MYIQLKFVIRNIVALLCGLSCFTNFAQKINGVEYSSKLYTRNDGLWVNFVEKVIASESGEVFMLNAKGVLCYDGVSFKPIIERGQLDFDSRITMNVVKDHIILAVADMIYVYSTNGKLVSSKRIQAQNCLPAFEIGTEGNSAVNKAGMWALGKEDNSSFEIDVFGNVYYRDGDDVKFVNYKNLKKEFSVRELAGLPVISCSKINYLPNWIKYQLSGFVKDNKGQVWIELKNGKGMFTYTNKGAVIVPVEESLITDVFIDKKNQLWIQTNSQTAKVAAYTYQGKKIQAFEFLSKGDELAGTMCENASGEVFITGFQKLWCIQANGKVVSIEYPKEIAGRSGEFVCFSTSTGEVYLNIRGLVYHIQNDYQLQLIYRSVQPYCTLPFHTTDKFGALWLSDCSTGLVKLFPSVIGITPAPKVAWSQLFYWSQQPSFVCPVDEKRFRTTSVAGTWNLAETDTFLTQITSLSNLIYSNDTAVFLFQKDNTLFLGKTYYKWFQFKPLQHKVKFNQTLWFGSHGFNRKDGFNDLIKINNNVYVIHFNQVKEDVFLEVYALKSTRLELVQSFKTTIRKNAQSNASYTFRVDQVQTNKPKTNIYRIDFFEESHFLKSLDEKYVELKIGDEKIRIQELKWNLVNAQTFFSDGAAEYLFSPDSVLAQNLKVDLNSWLHLPKTNARTYFATNVVEGKLLINSRQSFYGLKSGKPFKLTHPKLHYITGVLVLPNQQIIFKNENELYSANYKNEGLKLNKLLGGMDQVERYQVMQEPDHSKSVHIVMEKSISKEQFLVSFNLVQSVKTRAPELKINEVRVNGVKHKYSHEFTLAHYQNQLEIELLGIHTTYGENLMYTYFIDGLTEKWSPPQKLNTISLTGLSPGQYVIKVKALIPDHQLKSGILELTVNIAWPWWQSTLAYIGYTTLLIMLVLVVMRYRTLALKKRQLLLEETVKQRTIEIVQQKNIIEQKNKEILDSIQYAKKIQAAILPPASIFNHCFPDNFIFYLPKDIVAGDFYWIHSTEDSILFAVADCTGHGVPGAMVSVVCNNALNRSVREFGLTDPGQILNRTREIVIHEFDREVVVDGFDVNAVKLNSRETGSGEIQIQDGMDIALCQLKGNKLKFSGANNPVLIYRRGECLELKGQKQPIGKYQLYENFNTQEIDVMKGDVIYLFSDGYADQFGGDKGKKFKHSNLQKLLMEIGGLELNQQKEKLQTIFEQWKGELEQLDDVCLIGIKV